MGDMIRNVVHELGHAFYHAIGDPALGNSFKRNALRDNPCKECYVWQMHPPSMNEGGKEIPTELFADTFIAWTFDTWNPDPRRGIVDAVSTARAAMDGFVPRP